MHYPDKKSLRYPVPFSLKIEKALEQDMEFADSAGKDVGECARMFLREGFAKLRAEVERKRLASQSEAS